MQGLKRVLMAITIGISVVMLVLSLTGIAGCWMANAQISGSIVDVLTVADTRLETVDKGLDKADAALIEEQFPEITEETRHAVVILNLMKAEDLGSTFIQVIERYAEDLAKRDSKLILASISVRAKAQLDNTGMLKTLGRENVFLAIERIGESVTEAWYVAQKWITEVSGQPYGVGGELPATAERFGLDKELES